jgi:hypothetical protein
MKKQIVKAFCVSSLVLTTSAAWGTCKEIEEAAAATAEKDLAAIADKVVTANQATKETPAGLPTNVNGGGFGLDMWVTAVDETGKVCQIVNTARHKDTENTLKEKVGNQSWLGSRVISAQKANTANAFSLDAFSISTANLYGLVLEGGSLYGLQHSNPVDASEAYLRSPKKFGTGKDDPLANKRIGGVNVFGGGLALYKDGAESKKVKVGAIGVSGDTSCTDHAIAWRIRAALGMDKVPGGFQSSNGGAKGDELALDIKSDLANTPSQPECANTPAIGTDNGVIDLRAP